jgi:hypothetical protein
MTAMVLLIDGSVVRGGSDEGGVVSLAPRALPYQVEPLVPGQEEDRGVRQVVHGDAEKWGKAGECAHRAASRRGAGGA